MRENENNLEKEVEKIYTPLSVAKEEIWRRWNDKALRKKVEEFLGGDLPDLLGKEPRAIILRYVATPNFETSFFLDIAEEIGLKPLYGEFLEDKYCTMNQDKVHLARMVFLKKEDGHGLFKLKNRVIVDGKKNEGKLLKVIKTIWGDNLVDFHHKLFHIYHPGIETFNAYNLRKNDNDVVDFYEKIFSVCLYYGILFENFIGKDGCIENKFTKNIILPAYRRVTERFNLKPLISPIYSIDNEDDNDWMRYPSKIEIEVDKINKPC